MGMQSVSIIGIGRVGGALAIALSRAGFTLDHLVHRDPSTAKAVSAHLPASTQLTSSRSLPELRSDIVLITTADPDISVVAAKLAGKLKPGAVVLHTSGSLSSEVLSGLAAQGSFTGSMHPLVSVSDAVSGADSFSNVFFCIEGDEAALTSARLIVEALGGRAFSIDSNYKPLYHAAAVTACGHLVALIDVAIEMLSKCGVERAAAKEILMPLIYSTIGNLKTHTPENALTGSFARADNVAFERHLASIDRSMSPLVRDIYLSLGERSLDLAAANGVDPVELENLRELISIAKRKPEC